jgi:hypothetical protein
MLDMLSARGVRERRSRLHFKGIVVKADQVVEIGPLVPEGEKPGQTTMAGGHLVLLPFSTRGGK